MSYAILGVVVSCLLAICNVLTRLRRIEDDTVQIRSLVLELAESVREEEKARMRRSL